MTTCKINISDDAFKKYRETKNLTGEQSIYGSINSPQVNSNASLLRRGFGEAGVAEEIKIIENSVK